MCGRFTLTVDPAKLQRAFPWADIPEEMPPSYNIAPTQPVAVIPNTPEKKMDYFVWGLIPFWAKDPSIGNKMINARSETLAEKPSFRNAYKRRRCLVLADGFYEWQKVEGQSSKIPHYIHMKDGSPFAFAGLWEIWHADDASEIRSVTIITTRPNELVKPIHNRMPVILQEAAYDLWLDTDEVPAKDLNPLLVPYPAEKLEAYPVSTTVNSPANNNPELIKPTA